MKNLVVAFALSNLALPALAQDAPKGDVANGQRHFMSDGCYQCHGVGGLGAALTGPKIARTALPFASFLNQLRHPAAEMAPYEAKIVPDQTVADIYAYLQAQPESPKAKDLPLLLGMGVK